MKQNFENPRRVLLPLLSSFEQIFRPVPTVYVYGDIGLQSLVRKSFLDEKQNDFLKIISQYDK